MANRSLSNARRTKNDEFYTQYSDIQKEIEAYLDYNPNTFRNKKIYCNCDDPYESHFFRFFVLNFKKLGLQQLITTSYKPSPIANTQMELFGDDKSIKKVKGRPKINANRFIINDVSDIDGDGEFSLKDVALQLRANKHNEWEPLDGNGDFRSDESIFLLEQSDIVVTNPPFSLFREYIKQLIDYSNSFIIIGNMNAITYKEVFPLIRDNKIWLGATGNGSDMVFGVPKGARVSEKDRDKAAKLGYIGDYTRLGNSCWFTNLDHGRRHQPLPLMTEMDVIKFCTKKKFLRYDNYDAIEIPYVKYIPSDYQGVMGVPISFLDKYSPEQFEILGTSDNGLIDDKYKATPGLSQQFVDDYYEAGGTGAYQEGNPTAGYYDDGIAKMAYKRIFIKHKEKYLENNS